MKNQRDKTVVEHWLRLYNRLTEESFVVVNWPDSDSSKKNIDAMCCDSNGHTLAIEHTLIEPFANEKNDAARFERTLMSLENHPGLLQPGYSFMASQPVGSTPTGMNWVDIPSELLRQLPVRLAALPDGDSSVDIQGERWELSLRIKKIRLRLGDSGKFLTGRVYPGDPGPELVVRALEKKVQSWLRPALRKSYSCWRRTLLLERLKVSLIKFQRNMRLEDC